MRTAIQAVLLLAIVGMPIVYLMYFFVLNDFKNKLITLNKDAWDRSVGIGAPQNLENVYRALQQSSKGQLAGIALCVTTKCVLGLLMTLLVSSCGKSSMPAATESAGLRIESELFSGCDRDGESVVQVDLKFVNVSQRPLEIYFPPNWGLYGGLRFVAYDQEQEPLKLRNLLHGIPLPISDDDYRKVTWHIPEGGHVLLTKVERIDEEFSKSDSLAYANVEYFSPLPADLFKSQALFWRGERIASELRPIKAKSCNESPAPN